MGTITISVFHTGEVCVSPYLPFGGDDCNILQVSGLTTGRKDRLWLPVSAYFIAHPKGNLLVDCGWHRSMSPKGELDRKAQIKSLGSRLLYLVNQGRVETGAAVDEQLAALGIRPSELDYVLLTHLDCDHVSGLELVKDAKHILVSNDEIRCSKKKSPVNRVRYQSKWWRGCQMEGFDWNDTEGPCGRAFDLFGDGSVKMIHIPGHCDGLCAVKIRNDVGKYVLLASDGGYAASSWDEMITPGVCMDKAAQKRSLAWLREQSRCGDCLAILANHDAAVRPCRIEL